MVQQWFTTSQLSVDDIRRNIDKPVQQTPAGGNVSNRVSEALKNSDDPNLAHTITLEEHQAVVFKLREVAQLHPGALEKQDLLYLEQQLTDIFGFEVTSQLEGRDLPFIIGTMAAAPHNKRFPSDQLTDHGRYLEAGMAPTRTQFGWMLDSGQLSDTAVNQEAFGISLPLTYLPEWQTGHQDIKSWFKFRKVVVINPFELRAVVCAVNHIAPVSTLKYQFEGSPELIRMGSIWSPKTQGRVIVLFVNDEQNQVPLGPILLAT